MAKKLVTVSTEEQRFLIENFYKQHNAFDWPVFSDFSPEITEAILDEAYKFANEELAPLNRSGDIEGSKLNDGKVTTPQGFKEAYQKFVENGWNSAPFPQTYGGMGLPYLLHTATSELWNSANMAFTLCPMLTQSAIELLLHHASDSQKDAYLPNLISGKWTATMCLTEPQAGSDVGALTTKATPHEDHYLIEGQKIFITYGDHDLTDNIIHMVLARTPDAPEGPKGISLFIVPKFLEDGTSNDLKAVSLEHKLGIHASPTAVMSFGDNKQCIGYLVGEENKGLAYMFTMMNQARLAVGLQGVGIAQGAFYKAQAYAQERVQGRAIDGSSNAAVSIDQHPDIEYKLTEMETHLSAIRAITYYSAYCLDTSIHHPDETTRKHYEQLLALMIPIAKAYSTDQSFAICSEALQVFGGMGYIEETGIAQDLRDARITMIYEGTNGIQALDLLMRKILQDDGQTLINALQQFAKALSKSNFEKECQAFEDISEKLIESCRKIVQMTKESKRKGCYIASPFLSLCGMVFGYYFTLSVAIAASSSLDYSDTFKDRKISNLSFYHRFLLPKAESLAMTICRL